MSTITDEVRAEIEQWQQRPLEAIYPIVNFDVLCLKIHDEGAVRNNAVYLALGSRADGKKEVVASKSSKQKAPCSGSRRFTNLRTAVLKTF